MYVNGDNGFFVYIIIILYYICSLTAE